MAKPQKEKTKDKNNVMGKLTKQVQQRGNGVIHPNAQLKHNVITPVEDTGKNVASTLESNNLDEFLSLAKLSQKKYDVLNEQIVMQNMNGKTQDFDQNQFNNQLMKNVLKNSEINHQEIRTLAIPKRPLWKEGILAKEFERMERESFLNWRRGLAEEEEKHMNLAITPFEKNIEIWRQLWLVVEKSQILIQIVDGRNPLFFRSPDLELYIKDTCATKDTILLINKSDLLTEEIRRHWADFFIENGIKYIFFSALVEGDKLEKEEDEIFRIMKIQKNLNEDLLKADMENAEAKENDEDEEEEEVKTKNQFSKLMNEDEEEEKEVKKEKKISNEIKEESKEKEIEVKKEVNEEIKEEDNKIKIEDVAKEVQASAMATEKLEILHSKSQEIKILDREEFIETLKNHITEKAKNKNAECWYIGFIGYPNVGKSSVINVLMKKKRVGVALMPGKTKHYQTLYLPETKEICLMDCPGLVFPSFLTSKAEMLTNGILPVDTLRDYLNPIAIIIKNIPRKIIEMYYRIILPDIYSATQFLQLLASKRGFITGRSLPDEARTSKMILKDYVSGKLLFCYLRPDYDVEKHGSVQNYMNPEMFEFEFTEEEKKKQEIINEIPADFDDNYEKIDIKFDDLKYLGKENHADDELNEKLEQTEMSTRAISKDMKRYLKFAMKRGDITEEEYESVETTQEFQVLMAMFEKTKKNPRDMVKSKKISEYDDKLV